MSQIKAVNTKPEILIRKYLFSKGFRFRLHVKELAGKPDIVLRKYKTAIFVNGCFWHGHENCKYFKVPKTRTDFWLEKIKNNKKNDKRNNCELLKSGWLVYTIFECELKKNKQLDTLNRLLQKLQNI